MATRVKGFQKPTEASMPKIERCCHLLLGSGPRSLMLTAGMRLVAMTLLLWREEWPKISEGRYGMSADEIAACTTLTPEAVDAILVKLEGLLMVRKRADGWELTFDQWLAASGNPASVSA